MVFTLAPVGLTLNVLKSIQNYFMPATNAYSKGQEWQLIIRFKDS